MIADTDGNGINIGDVYLVEMDRSNGIVPKHGENSRNKFFIVLGFDDEGYIYGGVIINSKINRHIPQSVKDYQMPVKCSKYTFLDHDSFVDCSALKTAHINQLLKSRLKGSFDDEDVQMVIGTIKESPNESKARLRMFGLL